MRLTLPIAVLAALLAVPAASQAAVRWTVEGKASVRNYRGDFVIGTAYARTPARTPPP